MTYTETVERTEVGSPDSTDKNTRTITTTLTSEQIPSDIQDSVNNDTEIHENLQKIVNQFMHEERKNI